MNQIKLYFINLLKVLIFNILFVIIVFKLNNFNRHLTVEYFLIIF